MIKLISKTTEEGLHEQIWMLTLFHVEPTTYFKTIRNKSEYEVDIEARNERAQIIVSAVGKYISHEQSNGLKKDQLEEEAIDRLTNFYNYIQDHKLKIKFHCKKIIELEPLFKRIARPGTQYVYYKVLQSLAKEQLEYEKDIEKI